MRHQSRQRTNRTSEQANVVVLAVREFGAGHAHWLHPRGQCRNEGRENKSEQCGFPMDGRNDILFCCLWPGCPRGHAYIVAKCPAAFEDIREAGQPGGCGRMSRPSGDTLRVGVLLDERSRRRRTEASLCPTTTTGSSSSNFKGRQQANLTDVHLLLISH